MIDPDKYVVFKREDLHKHTGDTLFNRLNEFKIEDAVVIRRQDKFASPCLLTYAQMIAMVADIWPNKKRRAELQAIADYFHEQGVLAGEEAHHFPTL